MNGTVKLLLGVHAHQPVGNFDYVVDTVLQGCYRPFFETLERHPGMPFTVHISGWLLDQLRKRYPSDIERLRRMVARGQAEIVGGGDMEPVLAAIPEPDRRLQIRAMSNRVRDVFGVKPRGAWLTERVWEPTVVAPLAACGIRYTAVDDYHFLCAGKDPIELGGYFATEESGARLDLFPISEALRYRIPFDPVAETIAYLESLPDGWAAVYFDDIEKFGIWPDTHAWVYERGWLAEFLSAVEASPRLEPLRFDDYHERHAARGVIYLPSTAYVEMNEWTLPPGSARRLERLTRRSKAEGTFEEDKPFLRGGVWKNFFCKYPEANWMHKRVLQASRRLAALPVKARTDEMSACLHRAQANDAYWHGLFGGLYLPHLRRSVYANLARLEARLDALAPRPSIEIADIDLDGAAEIALRSRRLQAVVRPAEGASLCELTDYGLAHNFGDTLTRRDEAYFDRVRRGATVPLSDAQGIASIHDRIAFKHAIVPSDLAVDKVARAMFVDRWQPLRSDRAELIAYVARCDGRDVICRTEVTRPFSLTKTYRIVQAGLRVRYDLTASARAAGRLSVEINLAMPSSGGPGGAYFRDGRALGEFGATHAWGAASSLVLNDAVLGGAVEIEIDPPCDLHAAPLHSVSQSEAGFEKVMQAVTLTCSWPHALSSGDAPHAEIVLNFVKAKASGRARSGARAAPSADTRGRAAAPPPARPRAG